jgi:glycosyltransferase involved in cell wall biosynthesis
VLLVFGYPLSFRHFGGLVWIQNITDYLDNKMVLEVKKVSHDICWKRGYFFHHLLHIRAIIEGFFANPDIAILDTYGEASLSMWLLLRIFKPGTKIVTVFHHYEPISARHKKSNLLIRCCCRISDYLTRLMLQNTDMILTVSLTSSRQLTEQLNISKMSKIQIVGCSDSVGVTMYNSIRQKDTDFLCVGRIEKFVGVEQIWKLIKAQRPQSKFIMIGRASRAEIMHLTNMGIDHRGIVSEEEKLDLYSRSKVFIFPSVFEGYGIAVTEALSAGLKVVVWNLPVFRERFSNITGSNLRLIPIGRKDQFAKEALVTIRQLDIRQELGQSPQSSDNTIRTTWNDVGQRVLSALSALTYMFWHCKIKVLSLCYFGFGICTAYMLQ